ncbi:MAG: SUMF1/EgtB/PvdO family nonheme iron enzyme [Bacteroidota bacterium]
MTQEKIQLPEMVFVQGGKMRLGKDKELAVDLPDFWIGKYSVTNAEFVHFLNAKGNKEEGGSNWCLLDNDFGISEVDKGKFEVKMGKQSHPVVQISWYGAKAYCKWLSEETEQNYALPSETQWEYAARGGQKSGSFIYAGSNNLREVGWFRQNSHREAKPVGLKLSNELGIHDMNGNVWEWCEDRQYHHYKNAPKDGSAWILGNVNIRVCRGGSWDDYDSNCRVIYRYFEYPDDRNYEFGFRVTRY